MLLRGLWVVVALAEFVLFDLQRVRGFQRVYEYLRRTPVRVRRTDTDPADRQQADHDRIEMFRRAVSTASALYIKKVHCLQRAAALTRMLRHHGIDAVMLIGYQSSPIRCHAWVEVDRRIVSDPTRNQEFCLVLDRV